MGIFRVDEDAVQISESEKAEGTTKITVSGLDKTGLGCDLCRIILLFGLSINSADISTDGKWCYIVFWVVGKPTTRWSLLKKRLLEVCPSYNPLSGIDFYRPEMDQPKPHDVFLLKFWCSCDRRSLLHDSVSAEKPAPKVRCYFHLDVTRVLCELELTIKRVKVSTAPDGRVMDLFFVTDTRALLHTEQRQEETICCLRDVLGDSILSCEIEMAGPEVTICSQGLLFLPSAVTEDMFSLELSSENPTGSLFSNHLTIVMDNSLSPRHTVVRVLCWDHKGLIYDIMRTLKDYNIQASHGRFRTNANGNYEVELLIMQADGNKIVDPNKMNALCSRLRMELWRPLRVAVVNRGPDTELLVANPVELSGRGRPLVFHDITLALETLDIRIFSVEIGRHMVHNREWEVYRILIDETDSLRVPRKKIEEGVRNKLMGWE